MGPAVSSLTIEEVSLRMTFHNTETARKFAAEKLQKINLFETEQMFCDVYCLEPGQEQKVHSHAGATKFYFVIEGRGEFTVGDEQRELAGNEVLTFGYGSGDAAEVIPLIIRDSWREATGNIGFASGMEFAFDLNEQQYAALHDGRRVEGLDDVGTEEFVVERVGNEDRRQFQDLGIEYYRYVG